MSMNSSLEFSPIEEIFLVASQQRLPTLVPQVWVDGRYRVDFYLPKKGLIIELDGHNFHSSPEQKEYDSKRDRYLQSKGFRVLRFTGREIYRDVNKCILEIENISRKLPDIPNFDISDRDLNNPDPDTFKNNTRYCSYMQKVINAIFTKYGIKNISGNYIRLKKDGYDDLSIGIMDGNTMYVCYSFSINGDRAVDPEVILYRYFDIHTERYEIIPLSYEHWMGSYYECAHLNEYGKLEIIDEMKMLELANFIEGMARAVELNGFLDDADIAGISKDNDP